MRDKKINSYLNDFKSHHSLSVFSYHEVQIHRYAFEIKVMAGEKKVFTPRHSIEWKAINIFQILNHTNHEIDEQYNNNFVSSRDFVSHAWNIKRIDIIIAWSIDAFGASSTRSCVPITSLALTYLIFITSACTHSTIFIGSFFLVFVSSLLNHCTFFDDQCYPFRLSIFTLMKFALVSVINLWLSYFNRIDLNIEKSLPISKYYSVLSTDKVGHACLNGQVSRNFGNDIILYWLSKHTIALYHDIKFEKNIRRPNAMLQHFKAYSFLVFNFLLFPPHCLLPFR